jgi:hypothetical protein
MRASSARASSRMPSETVFALERHRYQNHRGEADLLAPLSLEVLEKPDGQVEVARAPLFLGGLRLAQ